MDEKETLRLKQMSVFEENAYEEGYLFIAGIDEAGRGPLAGPVVAAACILPRGILIAHLDDSKKLTEKLRKNLYERLTTDPSIVYAMGIVEAEEIDRLNIYQATIEAMGQAVVKLGVKPDCLLVDGMELKERCVPCKKIIKGDQLSQSIAAASVIAKETRDRLMHSHHLAWPHYGFDKHKGYGTPQHVKALEKHGPCPLHRRTFDPLRSWLTRDLKKC